MTDLTGTTIGHYRLIAPLGRGGMATVYRGYQAGMERYVAVKVITSDQAPDPNFMQRFRQEARVIAALEHPNILPVYDYGEAPGLTYLVMRLVSGGTLAEQMQGQPLPLDRVQRVLAEIADALDYAHSHGVIHRDVKPSNILLDERGHALLSDFGIAKETQSLAQFTVTGKFLGTPYYASPEQALGQVLDGRSDLYSLGVILFELATGRQPYVADTPMGVLIKHLQEPVPTPRSVNPNVSPAVEQVIVRALAKHKAERYPTGAALSAALMSASVPVAHALLDHVSTPIAQQPVAAAYHAASLATPTAQPTLAAPAPTAQPPRRTPGWVWFGMGCGLLLVLLALAALAAWLAPILLRDRLQLPSSHPQPAVAAGFDPAVVWVSDALGQLVLAPPSRPAVSFAPCVTVWPTTPGLTVQLIFFGQPSPDCGGFAELQVVAER